LKRYKLQILWRKILRLDGKVAVITNGSRDMGIETAKTFCENGAILVVDGGQSTK